MEPPPKAWGRVAGGAVTESPDPRLRVGRASRRLRRRLTGTPLRILHVTDTHLGIDRWFRGAPRGWRRADDHAAALRTALAEDVDLVVHTGDLFDRSLPPARAVDEARAIFGTCRAPVVILPGNHDRRGLGHHALTRAHVVDRPARVDVAGISLAIVPYMADAGPDGAVG